MTAQQTAANETEIESENDAEETDDEVESTDRPTLTTEYVFERLVMEGATVDGTFYMATGQGSQRRFHAYEPATVKGFDAIRNDDGTIVANEVANHDQARIESLTKAEVADQAVDPLVADGAGTIGLARPQPRRRQQAEPHKLVVGVKCANCGTENTLVANGADEIQALNTGRAEDPLGEFTCAHCDGGDDGRFYGEIVPGSVAAVPESMDIDQSEAASNLPDDVNAFTDRQATEFMEVELFGKTFYERGQERDVSSSSVRSSALGAMKKLGYGAWADDSDNSDDSE